MYIKPIVNDLKSYLEASDVIDFDNAEFSGIRDLADDIEKVSKDKLDYVKNAYEYVRDKVSHSADIDNDVVTCMASDVLREGHGICFAKSHLLAALLRCKGVPAGFCYQKIIFTNNKVELLVYHGLNGVYIEAYEKWIRLDARGNKTGIDAQFSIGDEKLAYNLKVELGEMDEPFIYYKPDKNVIEALTKNKTRKGLWTDLPTTLDIVEIKE